MSPRYYQNLDDLTSIQNLLRDGLRAFPNSYFHPGDIEWWIFYNPVGEPPQESVVLWENTQKELLGWQIYLKKYAEYDMFMHPTMRGTPLETEMITWMEATLMPFITGDSTAIETGSVFADDHFRRNYYEAHGYTGANYLVFFDQDLTVELPEPHLPTGYYFLEEMHTDYADQRALVHYSAFTPSRMTPDYYRAFMQHAPMYDPKNDIVVVSPDGEFISFAMTWVDPLTRQGEFEPVGTHRDFHRRGFGRATLLEGLRRLKAQGMTRATVCCDANNAGNIAFYENAGFVRRNTVMRYEKKLGV